MAGAFSTPYFSLRISRSEKIVWIISVSKRVSKSAVVRNTIKRRLRPLVKRFSLKPAQYLLVVKPGVENMKGKKLEEELKLLLGSKL